jgi:hypothetical protein
MTRVDEHAMPAGRRREQQLIEKIRRLPADTLADVEDLDSLRKRQEERRIARAVNGAQEAAVTKIWKTADARFGRVVLVPFSIRWAPRPTMSPERRLRQRRGRKNPCDRSHIVSTTSTTHPRPPCSSAIIKAYTRASVERL